VVIIGGGVIGTSVAYHLAALGWSDVLLLEQGQLSCGTTWHAAGLVGQLRASEAGTRLVQYSTQLYERLEAETGQSTGFRRCGGVTVARTPERMAALQRTAATAAAYQLDCELISPKRAGELYPIMETRDLAGAILAARRRPGQSTDLTAALARGARSAAPPSASGLRSQGSSCGTVPSQASAPPRATIEARSSSNCAGQWAKQVGDMCGSPCRCTPPSTSTS